MDTDQKIALVTGANRGIGLEVCRQLAQQGVRVILTSRDASKGEAAQQKLSQNGLSVDFQLLDVTDEESIRRLEASVKKEYGRLHILINNAGIYNDNRHSLLTVEIDVMRRAMETNAYGPLMLCQMFVPLMRRRATAASSMSPAASAS